MHPLFARASSHQQGATAPLYETARYPLEDVPSLVEKVVTPSPGGYIPGMSFSLTEGVHHHVTKLSEIVSCSQVN